MGDMGSRLTQQGAAQPRARTTSVPTIPWVGRPRPDTPEHVDYGCVADAARLVEAVARVLARAGPLSR